MKKNLIFSLFWITANSVSIYNKKVIIPVQPVISHPIRTLLIDNFDSYTYNIWQLLSEVNGFEPYVVYNNAFNGNWDNLLKNIPPFDNIVISPGPGNPERKEDFGLCLDAILKSDKPLLGVCLGHQGMVHAYGGKVKRAKQPMHGRLSEVIHDGTGLFLGVEEKSRVVRYHSLAVEDPLPLELEVNARTADGTIMGLKHRSRPQYGVQFHPESIMTGAGRQILSNFRDISEYYIASNGNAQVEDKNVMIEKTENLFKPADNVLINQLSVIDLQKPIKPVKLLNMDKTTIVKNVLIRKIDKQENTPVEVIFEQLFGSSSASFWLDSESFSIEHGAESAVDLTAQETKMSACIVPEENPLSFFGGIEMGQEGAFSVEYEGNNVLFKRSAGFNREKDEKMNMNIFEFLRDEIEREKDKQLNVELVGSDGLNTFKKDILPFNVSGCLFGYLGYEIGLDATKVLTSTKSWSEKFNISSTKAHEEIKDSFQSVKSPKQPLSVLLYPSIYMVFDHLEKSYYIISIDEVEVKNLKNSEISENYRKEVEESREKAKKSCNELFTKFDEISKNYQMNNHQILTSDVEEQVPSSKNDEFDDYDDDVPMLNAWTTKENYRNDIDKCLDYINQGETYEVCLTMQFNGKLKKPKNKINSTTKESLEVYKTLRRFNPAPYACYLHYNPVQLFSIKNNQLKNSSVGLEWCGLDGISICSTSPERYLKVSPSGEVSSKPIKGTSRRDRANPVRDKAAAEELAADEKSQAENLMIVDLVRNDLGRVCQVGSVCVPKLMDIETFASVHQMVSTVSGQLKKDFDVVDALLATFPGGSMTGAPKIRTMKIINELEGGRPRGVYSGAMGYIGLNGAADLNIVIRTALINHGNITIGAGGAIVALSDPQKEVDEVMIKALAVTRALGYRLNFPEK